jgi:hypothetical protein
MSEAAIAVPTETEAKPMAPDAGQKRVTELRVTGHLMTLETGVFCVYQAPGSAVGHDDTGLPGVRISLPPGLTGNPDVVSISTFRPDGWLSGRDAAALVRVSRGPAQVLVTVYQSPTQGPDGAPRLQVLRLSTDAVAAAAPRSNGAGVNPGAIEAPYVVAHVQRTGDIGAKIGDWLGTRGSKLWIEGFAILPPEGVSSEEVEYQAVLGRGWNSPWMEGGKFCGSRGMALPLLGVRARLKGNAAKTHTLRYAATFIDGTEVGPVEEGEACEAESLAALEALQVLLEPRAGVHTPQAETAAKPAGRAVAQGPGRVAAAKMPAAGAEPAAPPAAKAPAARSSVADPSAAKSMLAKSLLAKSPLAKPGQSGRLPAKPSPAAPTGRRGR